MFFNPSRNSLAIDSSLILSNIGLSYSSTKTTTLSPYFSLTPFINAANLPLILLFTVVTPRFVSFKNRISLIPERFEEAESFENQLAHVRIQGKEAIIDSVGSFVVKPFFDEVDFFSDTLLILMLLRVYPYCKNDKDKQFILNEVNRLWK